MYQPFYLTVNKDNSFNLLPYLPNKKYLANDAKIFELSEQTTIQYLYKLINEQFVDHLNINQELN